MELRLREILRERSMTLKAFSEISGISQPNLSNYINGNVSPTLEMLNRIAESLKIPLTELFSEPDRLEIYVKFKGEMHRISDTDIINLIELKRHE